MEEVEEQRPALPTARRPTGGPDAAGRIAGSREVREWETMQRPQDRRCVGRRSPRLGLSTRPVGLLRGRGQTPIRGTHRVTRYARNKRKSPASIRDVRPGVAISPRCRHTEDDRAPKCLSIARGTGLGAASGSPIAIWRCSSLWMAWHRGLRTWPGAGENTTPECRLGRSGRRRGLAHRPETVNNAIAGGWFRVQHASATGLRSLMVGARWPPSTWTIPMRSYPSPRSTLDPYRVLA